MKIYLAGVESVYDENIDIIKGGNNLISFYTMNKKGVKIIKNSHNFLLDSGAYTFMSNNKGNVDWELYINKYCDFINTYSIDKFFELDIDSVIGYKNVLMYRNYIENITNKKCIPVWHINRGIEEYKKMCDEYDYVAIGGIVSGEIKKKNYNIFPHLIKEAPKRGAKVHGLGFTDVRLLKKIHFDSVDSTSWGWGRFGYWFDINGAELKMNKRPEGKRALPREIQKYNLLQWRKLQKYAEVNL